MIYDDVMRRQSARQTISRLHAIRNRFGPDWRQEKEELLDEVQRLAIRTAADLRRLHTALCFLRAFPDSGDIHSAVEGLLSGFSSLHGDLGRGQASRLADTGVAGTELFYRFSFEVAAWLARRYPGTTGIDWAEFDDTSRLDELLEHLLHQTETDFFDSGRVSTQEWVRLVSGEHPGTDFDWLMSQLDDRRHHNRFWTSLYNAADIPLRCSLADSSLSRTRCVYPAQSNYFRDVPMQNRVANARAEIARPLRALTLLDRKEGKALLDVAMASLAVRHRETIHFNYANPAEVWVADVGRGVSIFATGLDPEHRYPVECTMGFLIVSNGVPIGYGGSSMLFRQANTGINIFDEYRGGEAAWLWVQVMRVFHALSGCTRFIANPYQFGSENAEALKSGAFWFYYRLGYRPVDGKVRKLARNEFAKLRKKTDHRTPVEILRKLATCDMHLALPGARQAEFFDEGWIETTSLLATRELNRSGQPSRRKAEDLVAHELAGALGIRSMDDWSTEERRWFVRFAPIVAAAAPASWTATEKRSMVALMRAKGGRLERDYARQLGAHERFFTALKKACRREDRQSA
jgi:hypothetical protein